MGGQGRDATARSGLAGSNLPCMSAREARLQGDSGARKQGSMAVRKLRRKEAWPLGCTVACSVPASEEVAPVHTPSASEWTHAYG